MNVSSSQANDAFLTYEFSGTSISLYGSNQFLNLTNANATYTIDDQEPITFSVGGSSTVFNQIIFETGQFSPGEHKLLVTYLGTNFSMQPLIISYFVQQNGSYGTSSNASTSTGSVPSSSTPTSISAPSGSSSNSSPPTDAIVGGVIGGLVLVSLLMALFFLCRRNNRRSEALSEMSYRDSDAASVPSPGVMPVNPFTRPPSNTTSTFQPQNHPSNGQLISGKLSHRSQPSYPASASTGSSGGFPPLTPLRREFSQASPAFTGISPSFESPRLPLTGSQNNLDSARPGPRVPQAATEPLIQRSPPSPQRDNTRFLWHQDSGARIPHVEENVVEFPPIYSPG